MGKFWSDEECRVFIDLIMPLRNQAEPLDWQQLAPIMETEMASRGPLRRKYTANVLFLHWYQRVSDRARGRGEIDPRNLPGPQRPPACPATDSPHKVPNKSYKKNATVPKAHGAAQQMPGSLEDDENDGDDEGEVDMEIQETKEQGGRYVSPYQPPFNAYGSLGIRDGDGSGLPHTTRQDQVAIDHTYGDPMNGARQTHHNTFTEMHEEQGARKRSHLSVDDLEQDRKLDHIPKKPRNATQNIDFDMGTTTTQDRNQPDIGLQHQGTLGMATMGTSEGRGTLRAHTAAKVMREERSKPWQGGPELSHYESHSDSNFDEGLSASAHTMNRSRNPTPVSRPEGTMQAETPWGITDGSPQVSRATQTEWTMSNAFEQHLISRLAETRAGMERPSQPSQLVDVAPSNQTMQSLATSNETIRSRVRNPLSDLGEIRPPGRSMISGSTLHEDLPLKGSMHTPLPNIPARPKVRTPLPSYPINRPSDAHHLPARPRQQQVQKASSSSIYTPATLQDNTPRATAAGKNQPQSINKGPARLPPGSLLPTSSLPPPPPPRPQSNPENNVTPPREGSSSRKRIAGQTETWRVPPRIPRGRAVNSNSGGASGSASPQPSGATSTKKRPARPLGSASPSSAPNSRDSSPRLPLN